MIAPLRGRVAAAPRVPRWLRPPGRRRLAGIAAWCLMSVWQRFEASGLRHWDQKERFCLGSFPRHGARGACNQTVATGLEATPALRRRR